MCVIPWIIEKENRNVVDCREDFDAAGGRKGKIILVLNLESKQFESPKSTNVSYDLRVGPQYRHYGKGAGYLPDDPKKGIIKVRPGRGAIIQTEEEVHLPESFFGQILPKESLLQQGISNTPTKVDPGYSGPLHITVYNHGRRTVKLARYEPFCAFYLLRVDAGVRPYDKASKEFAGEVSRGVGDIIYDSLSSHLAWRALGVIVAGLLLIFMLIQFVLVDWLKLFGG